MFQSIINWLVQTIGELGYTGIAGLMFLESSFFPFPSEVVIPPAGYLASQKLMNIWLVILAGTAGSLFGALFNYWLALKLGRPFLLKYGRYFFIKEKTLHRADAFFARHGHISTFIARLLPGIRQYISLPAGLARMNLMLFCLFTSLGAGIWVVVLAVLGFVFGQNQERITQQLHVILLVIIPLCGLLAGLYIWRYRKKKVKSKG